MPTFVIDDGAMLHEAHAEPIVVSAADWPSFYEQGWPKLLADYERQVLRGGPAPDAAQADHASHPEDSTQ
jgi:hypothetical protein